LKLEVKSLIFHIRKMPPTEQQESNSEMEGKNRATGQAMEHGPVRFPHWVDGAMAEFSWSPTGQEWLWCSNGTSARKELQYELTTAYTYLVQQASLELQDGNPEEYQERLRAFAQRNSGVGYDSSRAQYFGNVNRDGAKSPSSQYEHQMHLERTSGKGQYPGRTGGSQGSKGSGKGDVVTPARSPGRKEFFKGAMKGRADEQFTWEVIERRRLMHENAWKAPNIQMLDKMEIVQSAWDQLEEPYRHYAYINTVGATFEALSQWHNETFAEAKGANVAALKPRIWSRGEPRYPGAYPMDVVQDGTPEAEPQGNPERPATGTFALPVRQDASPPGLEQAPVATRARPLFDMQCSCEKCGTKIDYLDSNGRRWLRRCTNQREVDDDGNVSYSTLCETCQLHSLGNCDCECGDEPNAEARGAGAFKTERSSAKAQEHERQPGQCTCRGLCGPVPTSNPRGQRCTNAETIDPNGNPTGLCSECAPFYNGLRGGNEEWECGCRCGGEPEEPELTGEIFDGERYCTPDTFDEGVKHVAARLQQPFPDDPRLPRAIEQVVSGTAKAVAKAMAEGKEENKLGRSLPKLENMPAVASGNPWRNLKSISQWSSQWYTYAEVAYPGHGSTILQKYMERGFQYHLERMQCTTGEEIAELGGIQYFTAIIESITKKEKTVMTQMLAINQHVYSSEILNHMSRYRLKPLPVEEMLAWLVIGIHTYYNVKDVEQVRALRMIASTPRAETVWGLQDWYHTVEIVAPLGYAIWNDIGLGMHKMVSAWLSRTGFFPDEQARDTFMRKFWDFKLNSMYPKEADIRRCYVWLIDQLTFLGKLSRDEKKPQQGNHNKDRGKGNRRAFVAELDEWEDLSDGQMLEHSRWLALVAELPASQFPLESSEIDVVDLNALLGNYAKGKGKKGRKGNTATADEPISETAAAAVKANKGGDTSKPGDWLCAECGEKNFAFRTECWKNQCKAPRAANAALADPLENAMVMHAVENEWYANEDYWYDYPDAELTCTDHADAARKGKGKGKKGKGKGKGKGKKPKFWRKPNANPAQEDTKQSEAIEEVSTPGVAQGVTPPQ